MSLTPKIIYGTAWKMEQTASLVVAAVLQGFRAIDTACQPKHYREDLVGQALQELQEKHNIKREDLFIQTKFTPLSGQDTTKPLPYSPTSPLSTQITTSFTRTLSNLQTTYVDSYLLHSPLRTPEQTLEAWGVLAKLQDEGKARLIGVSNTYDVRVLARLHKERKVQVVQNRWYEGNGWDKAVVGFCREHGIMYQSFWTLTGSPSLLSHPALLAIAQSANITPAQAVYRISQLEGIVPLSGTKDETHMREDVAVQDVQLDEDGLDWAFDEVREFIR